MLRKPHSEEAKRKMSESRCRPLQTSFEELFDLYWNKKMTLKQVGEKLNKSAGSIRWHMQQLNIPRRTSSEAHKGIFPSEETRKRMSESHRGKLSGSKNPMYGKPAWSRGLTKENSFGLKKISQKLKGRKLSKEWCEKISKARIGKYSGENHPNWQGGLKDNPYGIEFNEKLREQIRERDGFVCQLCGGIDKDRELQVHHINYNKEDNHPQNLISLCLSCHVKTNYNRKQWIPFFKNLILKKGV